jgi:hypothetical protein
MTVKELDVVTLPDGRTGTVVSLHPDGSYVVEVSDEAGRTLDLVDVPSSREAGNAALGCESEGVQTGPVEASAIRQSAPSESHSAEPYFVMRCRVCGKEIRTEWGPDVHAESRFSLAAHLGTHSDAQFAALGREEAYRGLSRG